MYIIHKYDTTDYVYHSLLLILETVKLSIDFSIKKLLVILVRSIYTKWHCPENKWVAQKIILINTGKFLKLKGQRECPSQCNAMHAHVNSSLFLYVHS